jgi:hypothetical protein
MVKKERSLAERILGWLKSLFNAITRFFATYHPYISPLLFLRAEPEVQMTGFAVSTLGQAAEIFCAMDSGAFLEHLFLPCRDRSDQHFDAEPQEGKEFESFDSVILFLKEIVPRELQLVHEKLERFDEALYVMGLESLMRGGRPVILYGPDPAAVAEEWRDLAKKYQSVLPDDEDLASDQCVHCYTKLLQGFC